MPTKDGDLSVFPVAVNFSESGMFMKGLSPLSTSNKLQVMRLIRFSISVRHFIRWLGVDAQARHFGRRGTGCLFNVGTIASLMKIAFLGSFVRVNIRRFGDSWIRERVMLHTEAHRLSGGWLDRSTHDVCASS